MSPLLETFGFGSVRGWRVPSAGAVGAYELIATAAGTGSSSTITFASIPAGYKHLQIRMTVGTTLTYEQGSSFGIRFNADSAANYAGHSMNGNGSSIGTGSNVSGNAIDVGYLSIPNNPISASIIDIVDAFSTTKNKTVRVLTGYKWTSNLIALRSGHWRNTATVTSVSIVELNASLWSTRSRFSLYGIKG